MTGISMHQSDLRVVSHWLLFSPHGNLLHSKKRHIYSKTE